MSPLTQAQQRNLARSQRSLKAQRAAANGEPVSTKKPRAKPRQLEEGEQIALFKWTAFAVATMPELELLYAIPNGGARDPVTAARLKAQGVKAGVLDMHLPVKRNTAIGLYVELKPSIVVGETKRVMSPEQKRWARALQMQGHIVCLCYGWEQARESIVAYLERKSIPHEFTGAANG